MKFTRLIVLTAFSGVLQAQSPDFDAQGIFYFQDSDYNVNTILSKKVTKSGMDMVGAFELPLTYQTSQNPSEQSISNSVLNNHRSVAFRSDKKMAYILETAGTLAKNAKEVSTEEIPAGSFVSVLRASGLRNLKPDYRFPVHENPTALALDAQNKYLAVSSEGDIQIFELDDFGKPMRLLPRISHLDPGSVSDILWHPKEDFLVYIREEQKEMGLIKIVKDKSAIIRLEQFGDVVKFEGNPVSAIFSKDGQNLFVLDKTPGQAGKVFQIRLSLEAEGRHALLSKVDVDENPSQMVLHPGGESILITNAALSYTPASFGKSSLSVLSFRNDHLEKKLTIPLEGIMPSQVRFDKSGRNFAVAFFQSKSFGKPLGVISFYKFSGGGNPKIEKQDAVIYLPVGVHHLEVVD